MIIKVLLIILVIGLAVTAQITGSLDRLYEPEALRDMLVGQGARGQLLFVAGFALIQPMGVPGFVFVIAAAMLWSPPVAFLLSMAGSIGAAVTGFAFARYVARDWVRAHLPARFHRFDDRLEQRSFRTVVLVYLVFFLAPPAHWVLGLSRVRFRPFLAGAAVGFIPGNAALVFLGGPLIEWLFANPAGLWAVAGMVLLAVLVVRLIRQRNPPA